MTFDMADGAVVTGILHTATLYEHATKKEVVIKAAKLVTQGTTHREITPGSTLIVEFGSIVAFQGAVHDLHQRAVNAEFRTDSSTKKFGSMTHLDGRELQSVGDSWLDPTTDTSLEKNNAGNWDQFETNKRLFNVKSTYDENLYTKKLDHGTMTPEAIARAERIAREIESQSSSNIHLAEERGQLDQREIDEEAMYSGVIREDYHGNNFPHQASKNQSQSAGSWRKNSAGPAAAGAPASHLPENSAWRNNRSWAENANQGGPNKGKQPATTAPAGKAPSAAVTASKNVTGGAPGMGPAKTAPTTTTSTAPTTSVTTVATTVTTTVSTSTATKPVEAVTKELATTTISEDTKPAAAITPAAAATTEPAKDEKKSAGFKFNPNASTFTPGMFMPKTVPAPVPVVPIVPPPLPQMVPFAPSTPTHYPPTGNQYTPIASATPSTPQHHATPSHSTPSYQPHNIMPMTPPTMMHPEQNYATPVFGSDLPPPPSTTGMDNMSMPAQNNSVTPVAPSVPPPMPMAPTPGQPMMAHMGYAPGYAVQNPYYYSPAAAAPTMYDTSAYMQASAAAMYNASMGMGMAPSPYYPGAMPPNYYGNYQQPPQMDNYGQQQGYGQHDGRKQYMGNNPR